ncbi:ABC transporter substrate-binding protein [Roseateles amylovorans]|uniref:ABC transporter substrate-binding protein n=1 Tax=Roseateles amylovorans TaxID=2978473 RepID=A0ABY6B7F1_9BURK|nr:ABC transporter substrate-binding protein [Roseateles amylovorans]UXH80984.1 ABC transporter substrate-binding protein [Roseateles amylovorans]
MGALAALPFSTGVQAQERRRLVLGQSVPLTGPAAQLGIQMQAGAKMFFDAQNAAGGINGTTIELRTLDDGYEPDRAKANTEKLINDDVFSLFGYVGTPTSVAALPLVNQNKIPFFAPLTGAESLRDPASPWVFHIRASYYDETALIVKQLTQLGLMRISVFHQNDAYGKAGLDGVLRAMKPLAIQPQAVSTVERNTVDVAKAVKDLVSTGAPPEAIVMVSAYKSCAAFIRAARKAGYGGVFYNVSFVGTQALLDELGPEAMGVVVSQVMPYPFGAGIGVVADYQAAATKAGQKFNYTAMEGYIAAKVFSEGVRRMARPTREGLVTALESMANYNVGGFNVNFRPGKHVGSNFVELSMLTNDGRVKR